MPRRPTRPAAALVLSVLVLVVAFSPPVRSLTSLPGEMRLLLGEEERVEIIGLPIPAVIRADRDGLIHINDEVARGGEWRVNLAAPLALRPLTEGRCQLDLALFGLFSLRRIAVEVVPRVEVVPGGESIGILLRTRGVTVVGHAPVDSAAGPRYPARDAGVRVGDTIVRIDGVEVKSNQHIVFLVNRCAREGRPVPVEVVRGGEVLSLEVTPGYSERERVYQLGLFVRDGAAGVGTLTFLEPESGIFMALGHVVADSATNRPLEVSDGRIVRASVARIIPGRRGEPGEKEGTFVDNRDVIGTITANTEFGIVGVLTATDNALGGRVPVALAREVRPGPAEIRTVVDGQRVERFTVEIVRVDRTQTSPAGKGITLHITDPRLLEATGGIIQGMSGSPILQDGRLVGAVTHVFVNDPSRGYGVFAEWMVRAAELLPTPEGAGESALPATGLAACCSTKRESNYKSGRNGQGEGRKGEPAGGREDHN